MKQLLILLLIPAISFSQRIVVDQTSSISGVQKIMTSVEPIFKMKAMQVAVSADLSREDSVFKISFYQRGIPIATDVPLNLSISNAIVVTDGGQRMTGSYSEMTEGMGMLFLATHSRWNIFGSLQR